MEKISTLINLPASQAIGGIGQAQQNTSIFLVRIGISNKDTIVISLHMMSKEMM